MCFMPFIYTNGLISFQLKNKGHTQPTKSQTQIFYTKIILREAFKWIFAQSYKLFINCATFLCLEFCFSNQINLLDYRKPFRAYEAVLKRIFILGRIKYRILFVWWKLNESNIEYYSLMKKIFKYYSNTWKYSNIRIYSNKFGKKCKVSESKIFIYPKNTF